MMQSSESNKYLSQIPQSLYLRLENALALRRKNNIFKWKKFLF